MNYHRMKCSLNIQKANLSTRKSESTDILLSLVILCSNARRSFTLSSSTLFTRLFHSIIILSAWASFAKISSFSLLDTSICCFESWSMWECKSPWRKFVEDSQLLSLIKHLLGSKKAECEYQQIIGEARPTGEQLNLSDDMLMNNMLMNKLGQNWSKVNHKVVKQAWTEKWRLFTKIA